MTFEVFIGIDVACDSLEVGVRVLVAGLCGDCRDADSGPAADTPTK